MSKITIKPLASGYNLQAIGENFDAIADELNNKVLYRNPPTGEPNSLLKSIDANGQRIYNLPAPLSLSDAARMQDVVDASNGAVTALGVSFTPIGGITATNVQQAIEQAVGIGGGGVTPGDLALKQDLLVSGTNMKTINGQTLLGSGDLVVGGGGPGGTSEYVSVLTYGAVGNNVVDDTAAINAALAFGTTNGKAIFFPSGTYKVTGPLVAGDTTSFADFGPRIRIIGAGSGNTRLNMASGSFNLLSLGGTVGLNVHISMEGLFLQGPGSTGNGLTLKRMPYFKVSDVIIKGFSYGVQAEDVLSGSFNNCKFFANLRGVRAYRNTFSDPNAISFYDCVFANNTNYGLNSTGGTIVSIHGGSIEGNGIGGTDPFTGGLYATTGEGGAQGVNLNGVYFEHNKGTADVYLVATAFSAAHSIIGCTFNRLISTEFVTNNVLVDTAAGFTQHVSIMGSGFKRLGTYVDNPARKYIATVNAGSSQVAWNNCYMQDGSEFPVIPNYTGSQSSRIGVTLNSLGVNAPTVAAGKDLTSAVTVNVTFVTPFKTGTIPSVVAQPINNSGGSNASTVEVYNQSNTGFTLRKYTATGSTIINGTFSVNWIAFGEN